MRSTISSDRATALGYSRNSRAIFTRGLQVPLGIGLQSVAGLGNRAFLANAGQHIGERLARGMVIECIGRRQQRRPSLDGQFGQLSQPAALVATIGKGGRQIDASPCLQQPACSSVPRIAASAHTAG